MEEERKKLDGIICTGREKFVRCFNECFFIGKIFILFSADSILAFQGEQIIPMVFQFYNSTI